MLSQATKTQFRTSIFLQHIATRAAMSTSSPSSSLLTSELKAQLRAVTFKYPGDPVSSDAISEFTASSPEWKSENGALVRKIQVQDFVSALALVNKVGEAAELLGHHPDIRIFSYNNVELSYVTHDAGNKVTTNDILAAAQLDKVLG